MSEVSTSKIHNITEMTVPDSVATVPDSQNTPQLDNIKDFLGTDPDILSLDLDKQIKMFEKIYELLDKKIETQEDLQAVLEIISAVSPIGKILVKKVTEKNVTTKVSDQFATSNVKKNIYTILHRDTQWGSEINIRNGATFLEVVHEYAHAIPIRELPEPLNKVQHEKLNLELPPDELAAAILRINFLDEAISRAAEIEVVKAFEQVGLVFVENDIRIRQNYAENGIQGIADKHSELFPEYDQLYAGHAQRAVEYLQKPGAELLNISWTDVMEDIGISTEPTNNSEQPQFSIDPAKSKAKIADYFSSRTKNEIVTEAVNAGGKVIKKVQDFIKERISARKKSESIGDAHESIGELGDILFEPRPQPQDSENDKIASKLEKTKYRVNIAGKFVSFVEETIAVRPEAINYFSAQLEIAEHSYGERAAQLYQELYEKAKKVEKPDQRGADGQPVLLKDIGLSLLKAGYEEQAKEILIHYIADYGINLDYQNMSILIVKLLELGQPKLAHSMLDSIRVRLKKIEGSVKQRFIDYYKNIYGKWTEKGQQKVDTYFLDRQGQVISANEFHSFMVSLGENGDFVFDNFWKNKVIENRSNNVENDYYRALMVLEHSGQLFAKIAVQCELIDPDVAPEYNQIASDMYQLAIFGADQNMRLLIDR